MVAAALAAMTAREHSEAAALELPRRCEPRHS
jgi:hypothetical protein